MQEKELEIAGGSLQYERKDDQITVTGYRGTGSEAEVPERIEGIPVTRIGKKAFLSRKNLRRVVLPDTIDEVGDWAFAYCDGLRQVVLPCRNIMFGRAVFMECGSLVSLSGTAAPEGLLAAAVTAYDAYYLLDLPEAGSRQWLEKWDSRLAAVMETPDSEGFSKQVLCGEEDYGSTDLEAYISGRRKRKARLAFLRLLFPEGLSEKRRELLEEYLRGHTKGSEAGDEAWQVILREHGEDRACYGLFSEIGCVTEENLDGILEDIGEAYPEMKAFFLRDREERLGSKDFFADLEL